MQNKAEIRKQMPGNFYQDKSIKHLQISFPPLIIHFLYSLLYFKCSYETNYQGEFSKSVVFDATSILSFSYSLVLET